MTVSVQVPMVVTHRSGLDVRDALVVEELEPIGYLRVFRRTPPGNFLHLAKWDVLNVDGAAQ